MPDLTLDEADRCPHCGAILREPPKCCDEAKGQHFEVWLAQCPLSPEEAQEAYDKAEPVPLSPERIQEIVEFATRPVPHWPNDEEYGNGGEG